jgi:hypothetical protein
LAYWVLRLLTICIKSAMIVGKSNRRILSGV